MYICSIMWRKVFRILKKLLLLWLISTVLAVIAYRFVPVYVTPLMLIRCGQHLMAGETPRLQHKWVSKEDISSHLPNAVIASEDNLFSEHHGFDWKAIGQAYEEQQQGRRRRGGSTITQQTAKNVFLWPGASWVRKGFEAYFTVLIELCWSKERIMEVYLNSIEMGNGIYGAEAVAQAHFSRNAANLTRQQCALIAASLPNPLRYNSGKPSPYLTRRQNVILNRMRQLPYFPSPKP